jgi:hypothetical protein
LELGDSIVGYTYPMGRLAERRNLLMRSSRAAHVRIGALIALAVILPSCGGGGGGGGTGPTGPTYVTEASGTVGSLGGQIEVTDSSSPVYKARIEVPAGVLSGGETVQILRATSGAPPFNPPTYMDTFIGADVIAFSFANEIPTQNVRITVPFPDANGDGIVDGTSVPATALSLLLYDDDSGRWSSAEALDPGGSWTREVNLTGGTVTTVTAVKKHTTLVRWFSGKLREAPQGSPPNIYRYAVSSYPVHRLGSVSNAQIDGEILASINVWSQYLPGIAFQTSALTPEIEVTVYRVPRRGAAHGTRPGVRLVTSVEAGRGGGRPVRRDDEP